MASPFFDFLDLFVFIDPDLEKVKHQEINIPAPVAKPIPIVAPPPPMSAPPSTSRLSPYVPFVDDFTGEKWITLPNGNMIFVTDKTPTRYQRSEISDEEIECIMVGLFYIQFLDLKIDFLFKCL